MTAVAFTRLTAIAGDPESEEIAGSRGTRAVSSNWMWGLPISTKDFISRRERSVPSARGGSRPGAATAFATSMTTLVEPSRL